MSLAKELERGINHGTNHILPGSIDLGLGPSPAQSAYEKPRRDKDPLQIMKDYLMLKLEQGDWHGVSDAAMDIREMLAKEGK